MVETNKCRQYKDFRAILFDEFYERNYLHPLFDKERNKKFNYITYGVIFRRNNSYCYYFDIDKSLWGHEGWGTACTKRIIAYLI